MANYTSSGATLPLLSRSVPTLSVGELTALIKKALESGFGRVDEPFLESEGFVAGGHHGTADGAGGEVGVGHRPRASDSGQWLRGLSGPGA